MAAPPRSLDAPDGGKYAPFVKRLAGLAALLAACLSIVGCSGATDEQRWAGRLCQAFSADSAPLNAAYTELTQKLLAGMTAGELDRPKLHALVTEARSHVTAIRAILRSSRPPTDRTRTTTQGLTKSLTHYDRGLALLRRTIDAPIGSDAQGNLASRSDHEIGQASTLGLSALADLLEIWKVDLPDEIDDGFAFLRAFRETDATYERLDAADTRLLEAMADPKVSLERTLRMSRRAQALARSYLAELTSVRSPTNRALADALSQSREGARALAASYDLVAPGLKTDAALERLNATRRRAFLALGRAEVAIQTGWSRTIRTAMAA